MRGIQLAHSSLGLGTRRDSDKIKKLRILPGLRNTLRSSRLPYLVLLSFMTLPLSSCDSSVTPSTSDGNVGSSQDSENGQPAYSGYSFLCNQLPIVIGPKGTVIGPEGEPIAPGEYSSCDVNSTICELGSTYKYTRVHDGEIITYEDCTKFRAKTKVLNTTDPSVFPVEIEWESAVELLDNSGSVVDSIHFSGENKVVSKHEMYSSDYVDHEDFKPYNGNIYYIFNTGPDSFFCSGPTDITLKIRIGKNCK